MPEQKLTAHDLAADWAHIEQPDVVGFRLKNGGRIIWEIADYPETARRYMHRVRLHMIEPTFQGLKVRIRYVDPDTEVELVRRGVHVTDHDYILRPGWRRTEK